MAASLAAGGAWYPASFLAPLDANEPHLSSAIEALLRAVARAEAAVQLDSASWEAWGLLGLTELRLGQIEKGRADLERALAGDPYNTWFKNNIDLLDTLDKDSFIPFSALHTVAEILTYLHGKDAALTEAENAS